jgi:D-alanyl-D-alanine carboxypeptidase
MAAAPSLTGCMAEPTELADEETAGMIESPEPVDTVDEGVTGATVYSVAGSSCATSSVKGLSQQIIAEARCINGDSYVAIGAVSNLTVGSSVFPYLEKPARDKFVAALKANPGKSMTLNSALRTVAQQYMLYRWYQTGRCGISLAATPGNSNHETGLALDVSQYSTWKPILTNYGFKWLGSNDAVHFDYVGAGAVNLKGLDVKAFQRLWNRNNPADKIDTDGAWGPQTEARMKKAPAGGFAIGATCAGAAIAPDVDVRSLDTDNLDGLTLHPIDVTLDDNHETESCADGAH